MKEIQITKYESLDGVYFDIREACKEHERNMFDMACDVFLEIPNQKTTGDNLYFNTDLLCEGETMIAMRIRDDYDVQVINQFLIFRGFEEYELLTEQDIGTIQLFSHYNDDTCLSQIHKWGTPKQLKDNISKEIDKMFEKLVKEERK